MFTVGDLKRVISSVDDNAVVYLTFSLTKENGRHITRRAIIEEVDVVVGQGTLFDWIDIKAEADLDPENPV